MKKYYPILLSKAGELTALSNLSNDSKIDIAPVIDVLSENLLDAEGDYKSQLEDALIDIWSFEGNSLLLDFSFFDDVPSYISEVRQLFTALLDNDVNAIPVVSFDNTAPYLSLIRDLIDNYNCPVCIRASNRARAFTHLDEKANDLLQDIDAQKADAILLLDLGLVENTNVDILSTFAHQTINNLQSPGNWSGIVVASGSFLSDLGTLTSPPTPSSPAMVHRLPRYEWDIWKALQERNLPVQIAYGDYGTKHPYYIPAAFEGSASIKYTVENEYVIYRGRKASDHALGGGQYNSSAARLIGSPDYSGRTFSWGDQKIYEVGTRTDRPGNAANWVQYSQNHHLTFLHSLL